MKSPQLGVLPVPTFRYGGLSYVLLSYAKMKNAPFNVPSVLKFSARFSCAKDVRRSAKVLLENGSIEEVGDDVWKITPDGVQQLLDFTARRRKI